MSYDWLETTDFPSGTGGLGIDKYAPWVHPETKAVYLWDYDKNSWMLFASSGARLYSQTIDPALDGITLYDGDLWWDSRALELRVYHRPTPNTTGQYVTGRWVSSTNPQMSLTDLSRNLVIGVIELDAPTTDVYEGREVMFKVDRPYGGASDDQVVYEWRVAPNPLSYGGNDYHVIINGADQKTATMIWEEGTHVMDGDVQIGFNVYCKVTAREDIADAFVSASGRSESVTIYPKKAIVDPIDYYEIANDFDEMNIKQGSADAPARQGDDFVIEYPFSDSNPVFFMIPTEEVIAAHDEITFTLKDPALGDIDPADNIGSQFMASTGPINGYPEEDRPSGYLVSLIGLDAGVDTTIYCVSENDPDFRATLIVKARA